MCFVKEVFIQISQNTHESIWPEACNFIKKETLKQVFSCDFCEIFKNTFWYRIPLVATSDSGSESKLVYHNPPVVTENQRFLISSEVREASSNDKDQGVDEETGDIFSEINSNNLVLTNTSPVISGQLAEVAKQCWEEGSWKSEMISKITERLLIPNISKFVRVPKLNEAVAQNQKILPYQKRVDRRSSNIQKSDKFCNFDNSCK